MKLHHQKYRKKKLTELNKQIYEFIQYYISVICYVFLAYVTIAF